MIKKILIANRGEIALRIIRACQEMGIKTVALYPAAVEKEQFLETKLADESFCLEAEGILGYLDRGKIIEIAKKSQADAIHPGYGFLAENGDFADLCQKNGIKFIGPNGDTLRSLGNKIEARKIAQKIGSPLLPGIHKSIRDEKELLERAKRMGAPFLLKAANGGGGIGIEIIEKIDKERIFVTFQKLKREAENAFGSGEIFIEKYLPRPHHIEIQILGDGRGKVLHFGERECSIQRRHQKLIEEAPSPFLDRKTRERLAKLAVRIGEYLKYESLGTVEFLVGENRKFYFLEVNPRLQVEHPVTELITRIDLVKEQIKIANGEEFKLKQKEIHFSDWAMEFRIYAEDALNNFQPQTGVIHRYLPPGGSGIEIHSFCQPGQKIFPYFDNLISKMVVFDRERMGCIQKAKRAFNEYVIEGITTLIPFYQTLLENQRFLSGSLSTSFIEEEKIIAQMKKTPLPQQEERAENNQFVDEKELAKVFARIYQEIKTEKEDRKESNRWRISARMHIFDQEFL